MKNENEPEFILPGEAEAFYVGEQQPKTTLLKIRCSPRLLELLDRYCLENGIRSRSFFVRTVLNKALQLSTNDFITDMLPFLKQLPKGKKPQ